MDATTSNVIAVVMATLIMGIPFYMPIGFHKQQTSKLHEIIFPISAVVAFIEWILLWYIVLGIVW